MTRRASAATTPWRLFWIVVAASVVLPAVGMWTASWLGHDAVQRRATAGNAATAKAVAGQMSREYESRGDIADDLLVLLANGARLDAGLADAGRLNSPFCRVSFLAGAGRVVSELPLPTCLGQPVAATALASAGERLALPPSVRGGTATASVLERLNPTEVRAIGHGARWLQVQFRVDGLFTPVRVGATGSYAVVERRTGLVLAAAIPGTIGQRIAAPAGRRLLKSDRPGVAQDYAPLLAKQMLMAYQPVAGTPYGVFITLPTSEAFADANQLRDVMLLLMGMLVALGLAAAALAARAVVRRNREVSSKVRELHRLATVDALTGLTNRGEATRLLERMLALVRRGDLRGLGLVFVDLDGFKAVNDERGHLSADELLQAIAENMRGVLRPSDVLARFGGDEFVVIAPGLVGPGAAVELADRLRAAVAVTSVPAAGQDEEAVGPITASIGVAMADPLGSADDLLHAADHAMYRAKRSGGDTVVAAEAVPV